MDTKTLLQSSPSSSGVTAADDLPRGWSRAWTAEGQEYYFHIASRRTSWDRPLPSDADPPEPQAEPASSTAHTAPASAGSSGADVTPVSWEPIAGTDWQIVITNTNEAYYFNPSTNETRWTVPEQVLAVLNQEDDDDHAQQQQQQQHYHQHLRDHESDSNSDSDSHHVVGTKRRLAGATGSSHAHDGGSDDDDGDSLQPHAKRPRHEAPSNNHHALDQHQQYDIEHPSVDDDLQHQQHGHGRVPPPPTASSSSRQNPKEKLQQQIEAFKQLLRDSNITPFSMWEKELPKFMYDDRYLDLPSKLRRSTFEEFVRNRAQELVLEKKKALQEFAARLESLELDHRSTYESFDRKYRDEKWYSSVDEAQRKKLFDAKVSALVAKYEQERGKKRDEGVAEFMQLLRDSKDIRHDSRWHNVKRELQRDRRYDAVSSSEREDLFREYVRELAHKHQALSQRGREVDRTRDQERRELDRRREHVRREEAENELLVLYSEKIKDMHCSWETAQEMLRGRERFESKYLSDDEKRTLFELHLRKLKDKRRRAFVSLLKERYSISHTSTYAEFKHSLQTDLRFESLETDAERAEAFAEYVASLLEAAKAAFRALLHETKSFTTATSGPAFETALKLLHADKRWTAFDELPHVRDELIREYGATGPGSSATTSSAPSSTNI